MFPVFVASHARTAIILLHMYVYIMEIDQTVRVAEIHRVPFSHLQACLYIVAFVRQHNAFVPTPDTYGIYTCAHVVRMAG